MDPDPRPMKTELSTIVPMLSSADIERDVRWYQQQLGFKHAFGDEMYAGLRRDELSVHLQWHAATEDDPLNGGSVIRIFVKHITPIFEELVAKRHSC